MNVKDWISYDDAEGKDITIGGLGGFFQDGMRWKDYVYDESEPHLQALRRAILKNNIKITGEKHQEDDNGVPLFEDGKVGLYTYRAWGDLMAAIWSEAEDKDYCYMDFYM